jgi:hypothetical protein
MPIVENFRYGHLLSPAYLMCRMPIAFGVFCERLMYGLFDRIAYRR